MVKIRLARGGAKKKPFYSIVATDSRKRRDSGYIERLGYFNPVARGAEVRLKVEEDRIDYWKSKGAQVSDRVKQLLKEFKNPEIFAKKKEIILKKATDLKAKKEADEKAKVLAEQKEAEAAQKAEEAEAAKAKKAEAEAATAVEEPAAEVAEEKTEEKPAE
jgi:small subunit ribosomal protein S16